MNLRRTFYNNDWLLYYGANHYSGSESYISRRTFYNNDWLLYYGANHYSGSEKYFEKKTINVLYK